MANPHFQARLNRWCDRLGLLFTPRWRPLHRSVRALILAAQQGWKSADYGAGYLYQSCPAVGLRGFRDTTARTRSMAITDELRGRRVLEVGCNSGFLSLALATTHPRWLAFDNNPFLIHMGQQVAQAQGIDSVEFRVTTIESLATDERFDAVLSFANHSTWDGNMTLALDSYFAKLQALMAPGGMLYFESHHPALESPPQLAATLATLARHFVIEEQRILNVGSAWDRGRCFVKARQRHQG